MPYLPAIPPLPRSVLIALGTVAGVIVVWLWARIARTRHVIIQSNEAIQTAVVQLERIANSMDRVVFLTEARLRDSEARSALDAGAVRQAQVREGVTAPVEPAASGTMASAAFR